MQRAFFKTFLIWVPSILIAFIFIENGFGKILHADQQDKIIKNEGLLITTGILLLIATVLFLYNKTMLWGTMILALYMTLITGIHFYKGKPFEVTVLIVVGTILAAYLRKPEVFHSQKQNHT